jgi:hypothetical protein
VDLYEGRGFNVARLEADQELKCITNGVLPTILNVADADDHVHEVERSIRTIKERTRCTVQGLPFRRMPKIMLRAAVEGAHKALNQFPAKNGASREMSPLTIMTGQPRPDFNDFKIEFGAYALVFEDNDPTNTMKRRATGAIALTPTENTQGGHYFMSLTTDHRKEALPTTVVEETDDSTSRDDADAIVGEELAGDDVGDGAEGAEAEDPSHGNGRYNLRPNRERRYDNRLAHAMADPSSTQSYDAQFLQQEQQDTTGLSSLREAVKELQDSGLGTKVVQYVTGFIMTQMTAKAGIKKHGKAAIDALYQEFMQLHDLTVFKGRRICELTQKQKRGALRAISVIKEKRCGRLKGRTVGDGSVQRDMYTKEETSSPTISTDALTMLIMIDAKERRDVATADVAGAYLHAKMRDFALLRMEGQSVDILCDVCGDYRQFVTYENGKKVLYLELLKALYGCVQSALLWYELFTGTLEAMGFELNPYDFCVANKTINGKQCTIGWYVDDNKISHVHPSVVSDIIKRIEDKFGKMTVTRGKERVFGNAYFVQ